MNSLRKYTLPDSYYDGKDFVYAYIDHSRIDRSKWNGILLFQNLEECIKLAIHRVLYFSEDYRGTAEWAVIEAYIRLLTVDYVLYWFNYQNRHAFKFGFSDNFGSTELQMFWHIEIRKLSLIK